MSLRSTITALQARNADLEKFEFDKAGCVREWHADVEALYQTLMGFISELTDDGSISATMTNVERSEELLGEYSIPELHLAIAGEVVVASPIGRMTIGSKGRVDLHRSNRNFDQDRIWLVRRAAKDSPDFWQIEHKPDDPTDPLWANFARARHRQFVPLDRRTFEDALDWLLRRP